MNPDLASLIEKLRTLKPKLSNINGDRITHTLSLIKKRSLSIGDSIATQIAVLLNGYDISLFTDLELLELSKIDLRRIELTRSIKINPLVSFKHKQPFFDTGSHRIFNQVTDYEGVSCNSTYRPYETVRSLLHTYKP